MKLINSRQTSLSFLFGLALVGTDFLPPSARNSVLSRDDKLGVAVVELTPALEKAIGLKAHEMGRCGGFERIPEAELSVLSGPGGATNRAARGAVARALISDLQMITRAQEGFRLLDRRAAAIRKNPQIEHALAQVSAEKIGETLRWYSSFPTRYNRDATRANDAPTALKARLETLVRSQRNNNGVTVELVNHTSTPQKSVRVRIPGRTKPNEVLVFGGHLDSINFGSSTAPGADDNASGVSSLVEALQILMQQQARPARTLEFMFYAGEESGLLGSAEIAKDYKARKIDVVAVLQLDMTLFPGAGANKIASMTDFTAPWLRELLVSLNDLYIKAEILSDRCGYGCSDHASWYRQGFSTLMPFEATMSSMNRNIHTSRDVIDARSDFNHSALFAKIVLALALELGNSDLRGPSAFEIRTAAVQ